MDEESEKEGEVDPLENKQGRKKKDQSFEREDQRDFDGREPHGCGWWQ